MRGNSCIRVPPESRIGGTEGVEVRGSESRVSTRLEAGKVNGLQMVREGFSSMRSTLRR